MNNKLSKNALKGIVKECLIEILAEGILSNGKTNINKKNKLKESLSKSKNTSMTNRNYLNGIKNNKKPKNNKAEDLAANITSDPILSEMLKDTARTTLQEQIAAESHKNINSAISGDKAAKIANKMDPSELFGSETSNKWASLAFSNSIKK